MTSLIYPTGTAGASGETVTYTYWWGNHVYSLSAGASPYVQAITYDAAARMDVVTLGNNILKLDYNYYPWTSQGGRLQQIKTGIPGDLTSLQDLRYTLRLRSGQALRRGGECLDHPGLQGRQSADADVYV